MKETQQEIEKIEENKPNLILKIDPECELFIIIFFIIATSFGLFNLIFQ